MRWIMLAIVLGQVALLPTIHPENYPNAALILTISVLLTAWSFWRNYRSSRHQN
jgi:hypothetical protein